MGAAMAMGPQERTVRVARLAGTELALGADVFVPLDIIEGAPSIAPDGSVGQLVRLTWKVSSTLTTTGATMGAAMPGALLGALIRNVRVAALGVQLVQGGEADLCDLAIMREFLDRQRTLNPGSDVPKADGAPATAGWFGQLSSVAAARDRFRRESDGAVPLVAFSRDGGTKNGLRFTLATAAQLPKAFAGVVPASFASIDVFATVRYDSEPDASLTIFDVHTEYKRNATFDPLGGPDASWLCAFVCNDPLTTTGVYNHTTYDGMGLSFGQDVLYTGRSANDLACEHNAADASGVQRQTGGLELTVTAPERLPVLVHRPDMPVGERARGQLKFTCTTSTPTVHRWFLAGILNDPAYAQRLRAALASAGAGFVGIKSVAGSKTPTKTAAAIAGGYQKLTKTANG